METTSKTYNRPVTERDSNKSVSHQKREQKNAENNKMEVRTYLSIIIFSVNGLNASKNRVAEWINKRPVCILPTRHFRYTKTKNEGMEKISHANKNKRNLELHYLYIKKNFKTTSATRDNEGHYIVIKGSIQQEDRTLVDIYAPHIGSPKYCSK